MHADVTARVQAVLSTIDAAWRRKEFTGLDDCFDDNAVIAGPDYAVYASGRAACAESYREFATNASVLEYSEVDHNLRVWENIAVYTFSWQMKYRREAESKLEQGTDQLVLEHRDGVWRVV